MSRTGKTPTYRVWQNMWSRCRNPNVPAYKNYGGRGIRVCRRWKQFKNFLADMGETRQGLFLDRIDNSKGYSPANCQWRTRKEQNRNYRRNRQITYQGQTMCLQEWSEKLGFKYLAVYKRLFLRGWTVEEAFTTPVKESK